ncbi:hypothetical protein LMG27952_06733 [Paraburkholderia hiiakae]|uniref:Uncharacterized protein n=1 Tax=Paraburkholderia hiiakae TaxID=1081782 RepID=A0ABM8P878_9BURK|nr:hypothetical protein LMG27952_06733 [Paraburkholderia hiiakae]
MNVFRRSEIYLVIDRMQRMTIGNSQALLFCWTLVHMAVALHQ